jgi:hypothetical protein
MYFKPADMKTLTTAILLIFLKAVSAIIKKFPKAEIT